MSTHLRQRSMASSSTPSLGGFTRLMRRKCNSPPPHTHTLIHAEPCSLAAAVDGLQHALSRRVYQADEAQESEARCELLLVSGAARLVILSVDDPVLCVARKKGREY